MHAIAHYGPDIRQLRAHRMTQLRQRAAFWRARHEQHVATVDPRIRDVVAQCNSFLFEDLLREYGYDDVGAALIMRHGAQVSGVLEGRPSWDDNPGEPWTSSVESIIRASEQERAAFLRSVRPTKHDRAMKEASEADCRAGRMLGPFASVEEALSAIGESRGVVSRRFPREQPDKVRPCDDALRSGVNSTTWCRKRLRLSVIDDFSAQAVLAYRLFEDDLSFFKEDHEGAYRQVPLDPRELKLSIVVFHDPDTGALNFYVHKCLPFGYVASVNEYNRVSQAVAFLANKIFHVPTDCYFDDFWAIEPLFSIDSGVEAFECLNEVLGFSLKLQKRHIGPKGPLLGHQVDLSKFPFTVAITASRKGKLCWSIDNALERDLLTPTEAGSLAGQGGFAVTALYGHVGRAALKPVFARQHAKLARRAMTISPVLREGLLWLRRLVIRAPPKTLFSDAFPRRHVRAFVDARGKNGMLACVVFWDDGCHWQPSMCRHQMPPEIFTVLKPKGNYIQFMEMAAAVLFVATFGDMSRDANVTLYCDNVAQQGALSKGFSRDLDNAVLAGLFWDMVAEKGINVWFDRVASEENISDVPTREENWSAHPAMAYFGVREEDAGDMSPCYRALQRIIAPQRSLLLLPILGGDCRSPC